MKRIVDEYGMVGGIAFGITALLTFLIFLHYRAISSQKGPLVIPAGNTYLGSTPATAKPTPTPEGEWKTVRGNIYPYSFSFPASIKLATFPDDRYDMYAIDCCGISTGSNVLIGVDYKADPNQPKLAYVENWWHQFAGLKSVSSVSRFTNGKGLHGYRAKYVNAQGETPNTDIFFEVPGHPGYVMHLAAGSLSPDLFDKVVDSVAWEN